MVGVRLGLVGVYCVLKYGILWYFLAIVSDMEWVEVRLGKKLEVKNRYFFGDVFLLEDY